jgi:hypothetical protein
LRFRGGGLGDHMRGYGRQCWRCWQSSQYTSTQSSLERWIEPFQFYACFFGRKLPIDRSA